MDAQPGDRTDLRRRLPVGAEVLGGGRVHLRVWAPDRTRVAAVVEGPPRTVALECEPGGYFSGLLSDAGAGTRYRLKLDDDETLYPDPASRFQPEGPFGASQVVDPAAFCWSDQAWPGLRPAGQVLYEMHVGTFTAEGTWAAAADHLPALAELGVTCVEMMPIADFPGRFGWGYDGVDLFAPTRLYGAPDDLRRLVDRAHGCGLGVILDVVYNHLGPDGDFLSRFAAGYFSRRYENEWGDAINFDGPGSAAVREFFLANAGYWIDEYHFDGLRLDAAQQIFDSSEPHILAEVSARVRAAGCARGTFVVAEDEPQRARIVKPAAAGGFGLDAVWNDDFHHSAMVALTGRNPAYYEDHLGRPQEFVSAAKYGFLFQGQHYCHQAQRRGTPTFGLAPRHFVTFLQNHDQVANSATGERVHALTSPGRWRAMTALLLLGPGTPMLFQGQEFAASAPFLFFADHNSRLAAQVRQGRAEFLAQFPVLDTPEARARLADPSDAATFARCKLDPAERERHAAAVALHRDLLALRCGDPAFAQTLPPALDGAVLGQEAFVLRFFAAAGDRLLVVNLGRDLALSRMPEPLLAPPENCRWDVLWSSDDVRYGGAGTARWPAEGGWTLPGHAALVLAPVAGTNESRPDQRGGC